MGTTVIRTNRWVANVCLLTMGADLSLDSDDDSPFTKLKAQKKAEKKPALVKAGSKLASGTSRGGAAKQMPTKGSSSSNRVGRQAAPAVNSKAKRPAVPVLVEPIFQDHTSALGSHLGFDDFKFSGLSDSP